MTANEMRNLFKELYDGASAQEMGFDDIEVSRFLNLSKDIIISEKMFAYRNPQHEGFEDSSKREIELSNLKMSGTIWKDINTNEWLFRYYDNNFNEQTEHVSKHNNTITDINSILFTIPTYILFILKDNADIEKDNKIYYNIPIKNINEDNINDKLKSPFSKPDITVIYRTYETIHDVNTNTHLLKLFIPENSIIYRYNITFMKQPRNIVVDILNPANQINCDLHEIIHNDIVIKAVELALGSIGSQKIQIANYNTQKNIN